jgi:putative nucleotidyltransferase-like protein
MRLAGRRAGAPRINRATELLLQTVFLRPDRALEAWAAARPVLAADRLDPGAVRLLPLVWKRLEDLGAQDPVLPRLRGIYRRTWAANGVLFRKAADALGSLHEAGIPTMVLNGAAIVPRDYGDAGLRPMADCDILVSPERACEAVALLRQRGWRSLGPSSFAADRLLVTSSLLFVDRHGDRLDLHWYVFEECCYRGADDDWWAGSASASLEGTPTRRPRPDDQLLHTCARLGRMSVTSPIWAADVVLTVTRHQLDWPRVINQARARRLVATLRETLSWLGTLVDVPVPPSVLDEISNLDATRLECTERIHRDLILPVRRATAPLMRYWRYAALMDQNRASRETVGIMQFLRDTWGLASIWQVPLFAIRRGLVTLRR